MLKAMLGSPMTYVLGFAAIGAASIVAGVAILAGLGYSLLAFGVFMIAAARYITKGLSPNG